MGIWPDIGAVLLATVCAWVILFALTKLTGRQQLSELTMFDYISSITIGSIAAELSTELEQPWKPLAAMLFFGLLTLLSAVFSLKSPLIRRLLKGRPLVLLDNGTLYRGSLRRAKLDVDDFLMLCRVAGYFDLNRIQTALFECNGSLSIRPKSTERPATPADLGQAPAAEPTFFRLITDGVVCDAALRHCGKDRVWLQKALRAQGIHSAKTVFLALYDGDATLTAYPAVRRVRVGGDL